jgi:hypothetical protein
MYVMRLPDGRLRVPRTAVSDDGVIGDAYEEIGPDDPDYERLLGESVTEDELEERRRRWRDDDEELRQQFLAWKAEEEARRGSAE